MSAKSTVEEIRQRFDADVERFSNLQTGQTTTVDAALVLDLIAEATAALAPQATHLLDVGCGAGNYALRLLAEIPNLSVDLVDLSRPMLDRAVERVRPATSGEVRDVQGDIRDLVLEPQRYDVVVAAAVLHHLRTDGEWDAVFASIYRSLKPGGVVWIADLVTHSMPEVQTTLWRRYGDYLTSLKGDAFRDDVFAYIEKEDSPRPLMEQLDRLRAVGFVRVEVLHKTSVFAAFGGVKG